MTFFWLLYLALSFLISFLLTIFVKKRIFKILIFSFTFALTFSLWFKSPGENSLVPIFSIFFLENTILESNGLLRILRPLGLSFLLTFTFSIFLWKKTKN
tara:strand:- start:353 stop:652 length:300 start_codon:yes stop_codon:yes gene_type:complete